MKKIGLLFAAACALAGTGASATVVAPSSQVRTSTASDCYLVGVYYTAEATYYVYDCYDNGDGTA